MRTAAFIIGLCFICCKLTEKTVAEDFVSSGFVDSVVHSECRDRYLWIHVTSAQTPRFEAVDQNGVHSISEQLASRCGYTISTFKMDGFTTFRASYYSCFTENQDDEAFSLRFNVLVSDAGGTWVSRPVSTVCSGLTWTHREIICEEDYMEVNVNRESSCGGQRGSGGDAWHAAFSQAQRTASSVWQLMFLQSDGQVSSVSISEAQRWGYSLTATARRVVLRSPYKPPHAELTMVDGVSVEVVRVSLFFKQKLTVMMLDVSMACTVNSGSFDGARLLWDVPQIMSPLVGEEAGFRSQSLNLGVEGVLLDPSTVADRGFSLVQQGRLVQIGVPFGAEGGYRKSLVVNNVYKESYVIFLLYEHVFSLLYEDGSSIDTRHRMLRVLDSPLLCHPPFSLDQTISDDEAFSVYLGNIPADVTLDGVQINGKPLMMSESISAVVHANGSRAYELRLPFEDAAVDWMYLGQGVVQYSMAVNFTLTIEPRGDSYHHHTFITARVINTFPPEITAQCSDRGITFSVVKPPRAESLWEVGVDNEPLTSQLAAQRGYRLDNNTQRTALEVPVFSVGYTYEDINLSNFYGTFKLLLRDAKTLEVQTSTSKRCLFQTEDMIVCSADGTMTVVTTPTSTWPTVQPERTTLLEPSCGPKETDRSRVLFEFKLDSCGTRAVVGESYVFYENEILHDRQIIADGPNFISRQSQFKLTVRCFYPLSGVNRLSVDRIFRPETPGFGSVKVFESVKDSSNKLPVRDCLNQVAGNPSDQIHQTHQTPAAGGVLPWPKPGPAHFTTVPGHNMLLYSSHTSFNPLPEDQTFENQQVSSAPGPLVSQKQDQHVFIPVVQFNQDLQSLKADPSPGMQELTQQHEASLDLNIYRSSGGASTEEIPGYPSPQSRNDLPVLQTPAHHSPHLLVPANTKGLVSKTVSNPAGDMQVQTSAATSQVDQNLDRPGGIERRNLETVQSRVQNIRVKPLSTLVSSGHQLIQKPVIQQVNFQIPDPSQYASGPTVSSDENHSTSRQLPEHRGSNRREEHEPERTRFSTLKQEQGVQPLHLNPNQPQHQQKPVHLNPNQPEHQQKPVHLNPNQPQHQQKPVHLNPNQPQHQQKLVHLNPNQPQHQQKPVHLNPNQPQHQQKPVHLNPNQPQHQQKLVHLNPNQPQHQQKPVHLNPNQQQHQQKLVHLNPNQPQHQQKPVHLNPNQPQHQQKPVQSVTGTGDGVGASHIRIRPVPSLPGRLQTRDEPKLQNLQKPASPETSRTWYRRITPQNNPNTPVNYPEGNQDLDPTARGTGLSSSHTGPNGSAGSGSDLKIHSRSECSGQYGASVHHGIIRGQQQIS
ncbi:uncharacterized protein LOC131990882 isoform X2 [Centropristis striata]|uniref:uncharacterized protein LOC131990882 isoform X2 n=1 Tax=Centropristis striata TaxID=184440 RepID=UPI0027DF086E|nr:uncharacterized protein LOC131990882 isoform X2 [Centropristis striata]